MTRTPTGTITLRAVDLLHHYYDARAWDGARRPPASLLTHLRRSSPGREWPSQARWERHVLSPAVQDLLLPVIPHRITLAKKVDGTAFTLASLDGMPRNELMDTWAPKALRPYQVVVPYSAAVWLYRHHADLTQAGQSGRRVMLAALADLTPAELLDPHGPDDDTLRTLAALRTGTPGPVMARS